MKTKQIVFHSAKLFLCTVLCSAAAVFSEEVISQSFEQATAGTTQTAGIHGKALK